MSRSLAVSLRRSLITRLSVAGVGISFVAGLGSLLARRSEAVQEVVVATAADVEALSALLAPRLSPTGNPDSAAVRRTLETYAAGRTPRRLGRFIAVRVYDAGAAEVTTLRGGDAGTAQAALAALDRAAWPRQATEARSEVIRLDRRPHVHVLAPLMAPYGNQIGAVEGVFRFSDAAVADIRQSGVRAMLLVVAAVLVTTAILYPVVIRLTRRVVALSRDLLEANLETVATLGGAIAKRDSDTDAHNFRVTLYATRLAQRAGLDPPAIRSVLKGAFLHDVGKIGIRDNVLLKPGKLDATEFAVMQTHVTHGMDIVGRAAWLDDAREIVHSHQEKFDGSGYPRGLRGATIPLAARIFSIADVFDALTSRRPYKEPLSLEQTIDLMREGSGRHFDPDLLRLFLTIAPDLYREYAGRDDEKLREDVREDVRRYFSGDLGEMAVAGGAAADT